MTEERQYFPKPEHFAKATKPARSGLSLCAHALSKNILRISAGFCSRFFFAVAFLVDVVPKVFSIEICKISLQTKSLARNIRGAPRYWSTFLKWNDLRELGRRQRGTHWAALWLLLDPRRTRSRSHRRRRLCGRRRRLRGSPYVCPNLTQSGLVLISQRVAIDPIHFLLGSAASDEVLNSAPLVLFNSTLLFVFVRAREGRGRTGSPRRNGRCLWLGADLRSRSNGRSSWSYCWRRSGRGRSGRTHLGRPLAELGSSSGITRCLCLSCHCFQLLWAERHLISYSPNRRMSASTSACSCAALACSASACRCFSSSCFLISRS